MKRRIYPLLKLTAKKVFRDLRDRAPLFCAALDAEIFITKMFYNHISFSKKRPIIEMMKRLLIFNFIEEILKNGILAKRRKKENRIYFQIDFQKEKWIFSIIILEKTKKLFLLSCFVKSKKDPSRPSMAQSRAKRSGHF